MTRKGSVESMSKRMSPSLYMRKALITFVADDILFCFVFFREKKGIYISDDSHEMPSLFFTDKY